MTRRPSFSPQALTWMAVLALAMVACAIGVGWLVVNSLGGR